MQKSAIQSQKKVAKSDPQSKKPSPVKQAKAIGSSTETSAAKYPQTKADDPKKYVMDLANLAQMDSWFK